MLINNKKCGSGIIMSKHILKCGKCGRYTLKDVCPECGGKAINPKPPKYSPEDRVGEYRRKAKEIEEEKSRAEEQ